MGEEISKNQRRVDYNASDQIAAEMLLTLNSSGIPPPICQQDQGQTSELDGIATQTDVISVSIDAMTKELDHCNHMIRNLSGKLTRCIEFSKISLKDDDMVRFYTGLPNLAILKAVFTFVQKALPCSGQSTSKLSSFQEFVATLVKPRLKSQVQDLKDSRERERERE